MNTDRAGVVRIFGNPKSEGQIKGGDEEGSYYMAYDYLGHYELIFCKASPDGKVEWFEISGKKN